MSTEKSPVHSHRFVEDYDGFVGFGLDRHSDENTVVYYLQKFSDDALARTMVERMTGEELDRLYSLINVLMKKHLSDDEYHRLFLKEEHP
ncbi:MAG: cytoplasmic protein [Desulfobacterales bacterium]|jgi:hypothetical protein